MSTRSAAWLAWSIWTLSMIFAALGFLFVLVDGTMITSPAHVKLGCKQDRGDT